MGELNRTDMLKKEKLKIEKVDLGDNDFTYVCQMTGRERDRFEQSLMREKKGPRGDTVDYVRSLEDFRAKLAVNTVCNENGIKIFRPDDYETLSQHMSAAKLEFIINAAQELNKISAKDKDALVKNSEGVQTEDSTSDSVKS